MKKRTACLLEREQIYLKASRGGGILSYEVWSYSEQRQTVVTRYNLAYINPAIYAGDNGRVLGYDNAHGHHHRHKFGEIDAVAQELSVDLLFDLDQVAAQCVFDEADALLFDAASPTGGFIGDADHVGRDAVEAGNVGGLEIARLDELRVLRVDRQGPDLAAAGEDGRDVGVSQARIPGHPGFSEQGLLGSVHLARGRDEVVRSGTVTEESCGVFVSGEG